MFVTSCIYCNNSQYLRVICTQQPHFSNMKLQTWIMFLAVFLICEVAAKPTMNQEEPQNELAESKEVEDESQNVPDHHHKEADKSHMNRKERKIEGKAINAAAPAAKPSGGAKVIGANRAAAAGSLAKNPPCPKGQTRGKNGKCSKGFTG